MRHTKSYGEFLDRALNESSGERISHRQHTHIERFVDDLGERRVPPSGLLKSKGWKWSPYNDTALAYQKEFSYGEALIEVFTDGRPHDGRITLFAKGLVNDSIDVKVDRTITVGIEEAADYVRTNNPLKGTHPLYRRLYELTDAALAAVEDEIRQMVIQDVEDDPMLENQLGPFADLEELIEYFGDDLSWCPEIERAVKRRTKTRNLFGI
jgi:hypothetical protein